MIRPQESFANAMVEPGEQRVEEAGDVEQADGPGVQAELCPAEHLEELVGGTKTAGQGHKAVGQIGHERFALVHGGDDMKSGQTTVSQFSIHESLGNDTNGLAAAFEDGVGQDTHQTDVSAAKNQAHIMHRQQTAQLPRSLPIFRPIPRA